ncbi:MAG: FtsX-like permease family protein [Bacteroidota bacterium]|nr:FtsX-like permease family protein [Bacteroidota bacterium]
MIKFLFKGLMRDKSRSLLPIIVVALGAMITVFLQSYMSGVMSDSIESSANFTTGHVKVMTRVYSENISQLPNDMALIGVDSLMRNLRKQFPEMTWTERIQFGGLLDAPDSRGQTRSQGNVTGMGVRLLKSNEEIDRMNLRTNLVSGKFPARPGEILLSDQLFHKMNLRLGDKVTLISSGMYGDMAMYNFYVSGTLHFGINVLDRGMIIADLEDVRTALGMENATGEILGFFTGKRYEDETAVETSNTFNKQYAGTKDKFAPVMLPLRDMNNMGFFVAYDNQVQKIIILVFIIAMSIVLWNAGLIGGLRRYGEFGLRLAIGESKHEIYRTLVAESLLTGIVGSVIGVAFGLLISYFMEKYGIDTKEIMKDSTFLLPTVLRSHITVTTYYIGFIPGVFSTVIGAMLAGIGIYKRQTANLFKELES